MEQYDRVKVLGKGTYGKAWLVKDKGSQQPFVMKEIKVNNQQELDEALAEAEVLSKINHINITRYINLIRVSPKCVCIVMEFADDGDLADLIGKRKAANQPLEESTILRYLVQITQALHYIHARGILHRDVKTANVFLNKSGVLKLGDFGIARILEDHGEATISARTCRTPVGTPLYMSPELCLGERYGPKSDIWALGCVLYEMCAMKSCFVATSLEGLMAKIRRGQREQKIPKIYSAELIALVGRLLSQDAKTRPAAKEILVLPMLTQIIRDAPATLCGLYQPPIDGIPTTAADLHSPSAPSLLIAHSPASRVPPQQSDQRPQADILVIPDQRSPGAPNPMPSNAKLKREALKGRSMIDVRANPQPSLPPLFPPRSAEADDALRPSQPLNRFSRLMSGSEPNLLAGHVLDRAAPSSRLGNPGGARLSYPVVGSQQHRAADGRREYLSPQHDAGAVPGRHRPQQKDLAQLSDYYHQQGIKNLASPPQPSHSGTPQPGSRAPFKLPSLY